MLFAAARNLSQKKDPLEGSTTYMTAYVDVKRPCGKAERRLLDLISKTGGQKFRCVHRSQSCCRYITVEPLVDGLQA